MKLMTMKQYMKMSKPALIRKITKALRAMPKAKLARLCYNITKSKLPRLKRNPYSLAEQKKWNKYYIERAKAKPIMLAGKRLTPALAADPEVWRKAVLYERRKKKRKFSRKQLAAQRLFAKRARAGTLRKRRRR